jgi:hypothetical protein
LTRASIYFARAFSKQMDCRVKPGNDIWMAFARKARRGRGLMLVVIARSDLSAVAQRAKAEATKQSISSFARRDGLLRGACHRAALCADPLARNDGSHDGSTLLPPPAKSGRSSIPRRR